MSIYDTSTIGTATNRITFNGTTLPIYRVISRAPQSRQIRDLDIPIPFEDGVSDYLTLEGGSAYIITGMMYPGSETDYDNGLAALRKLASLNVEQNDTAANNGYVPYVFTEYNRQKQIFVKVLYVDAPESTRKGLVQPFRLVCKVKDPIIYSATSKLATTQGSNPSTSGGTALFPFGFPILFGASTYSSTSVATNDGDMDAYPISIKAYGPVNNPTVTNSRTGEYITVNANVPLNSVLAISYDKTSLSVTLDGVSVLNKVTTGSTYFKIKPGGNNIALSGSSYGSGAYLEMSYYSTWPLS